MKKCDILGVKTYSDPSYIFSKGQNPQPQDLRPDSCTYIYSRTVHRHQKYSLINLQHDIVSAAVMCWP